jgi:hypothetical protein
LASHRMLVFSNAVEGRDGDYNSWYDGRHVPEVLASHPAWVATQRYRCSEHQRSTAIPCPWRYLAIYELETDDLPAAYAALDEVAAAGGFSPHDGALADDHVGWTYTELAPLLRESDEAAARKTKLGTAEHEFVILTNATEGRDEDFLRWYDAHVPEVLEHYPGLTTGQLFQAAPVQHHGTNPEWEYLALYDLVADDVADYFAVEPHGLEGMTQHNGSLGPRPAQWVFTPISPRVENAALAAQSGAAAR